MRRWSVLVVTLGVLASGCSSGDSGGSGSTPPVSAPSDAPTGPPETEVSATPTEPTASPTTDPDIEAGVAELDAFGDLLDDDGTLSFDTALSLFAASITPLPGVTPSDTAFDDDATVLRRIAIEVESLTPEQRAVFDAVMGGPGTPLDQFDADGGFGSSAGVPRRGVVDQAVPIAREAVALFNRQLGENAPESFFVMEVLPMVSPDGTRNFSNPLNAASATGEHDGGDELKRCKIRLNRDALDDLPSFRSQLSHEIFHCYQYRAIGGRANPPQWASEGGAGWVGESFAGGSFMSGTWWARWIGQPRRPLVLRSYDAIGLFALADRYGGNTHQLAIDAVARPSLATITSAVGQDVLSLWGTHYGDPAWGTEWSVVGPGAPSDRAPADAFTPVLDGPPSFVTDSRTDPGTSATPVEFTAPGDVLRVTGFAGLHGALRFGDGTTVALTASGDYCLTPGGCVCPDGSASPGAPIPVGSRDVFVGIGPGTSTGPQVQALSLEAFCDDATPISDPPATNRDSCLVGRWVSTRAIMPTDASLAETATGGAGLVQVFRADGTFTIDFSGMSPVESVVDAPEGQRFRTVLTYTGSDDGRWSTSRGKLRAGRVELGKFRIDYKSELIGVGVVVQDGFALDDPRLASLGNAGVATIGSGDYACNGSTLIISNPVPGFGESGFEFTRS